jgi:hypothetical protein
MPYGRDVRLPASIPGVSEVLSSAGPRGTTAALLPDAMPIDPTELVKQAASILGRETAVGPSALPVAVPWEGKAADSLFKGGGPALEQFRRSTHELVDAVLSLVGQGGNTTAADTAERVPLLSMPAPAQPGTEVSMFLRVANEESSPVEVTLYSSNFVSDSGFEIPSLRVSFAPSAITIQPRSQTTFEVKVAVPTQAPRGFYSGLVQAAGLTYVKAVVTVEVQ